MPHDCGAVVLGRMAELDREAGKPPPAEVECTYTKTQRLLTGLIARPRMSKQLLAEPPVKFIRDVFVEVSITTGCGRGLFSGEEIERMSVSRENKFAFLAILLHFVASAADEPALPNRIRVGKIAVANATAWRGTSETREVNLRMLRVVTRRGTTLWLCHIASPQGASARFFGGPGKVAACCQSYGGPGCRGDAAAIRRAKRIAAGKPAIGSSSSSDEPSAAKSSSSSSSDNDSDDKKKSAAASAKKLEELKKAKRVGPNATTDVAMSAAQELAEAQRKLDEIKQKAKASKKKKKEKKKDKKKDKKAVKKSKKEEKGKKGKKKDKQDKQDKRDKEEKEKKKAKKQLELEAEAQELKRKLKERQRRIVGEEADETLAALKAAGKTEVMGAFDYDPTKKAHVEKPPDQQSMIAAGVSPWHMCK